MKFQRAGCSSYGVTLILGGNGLTKATGTSFHSFFFLLFSICSTIAMKCTYKFLKGWVQRLQSYIDFGRKWADKGYKSEFSLIFLHSFFKSALLLPQNALTKFWRANFLLFLNPGSKGGHVSHDCNAPTSVLPQCWDSYLVSTFLKVL